MTCPQPMIGATVHYVSYGTPVRDDGTQAFRSRCRTAVITEVLNDTTVGLCVVNPTGLFFHPLATGGVRFTGEGGPDDTAADTYTYPGGTWHWPGRGVRICNS
jgi:hypothetical protein